jgi:holliday junction DNA helicase RuvA
MIARVSGRVLEIRADSILLEAGALCYELLCPPAVLASLEPGQDATLETVHFLQLEQTRATPVLIGFAFEAEKEFWEILTGVLGPKSATKAMAAPIEHIARWIETGDVTALKGLPGIGPTKAREMVAKLQGKTARYATDTLPASATKKAGTGFLTGPTGPAGEAIEALIGLDYKRTEAADLVARALQTRSDLTTVEQILDEVFRRQ